MGDERYPIGRFSVTRDVTDDMRSEWMNDIDELPMLLRDAIRGLSEEQLGTPYRDGGWTVRQVVHHLADSHMNGYFRFKLALTEDKPAIKTYQQGEWAQLFDGQTGDTESSVMILEGLHRRWVSLLRSFVPADFARTFYHPDMGIKLNLDMVLALYAWHGKHHVGHILSLRGKNRW